SLSLPKKNPSVDFSWDCRIAAQFCMLLTRPPWLNISWQETITLPEPAQEKPLRGFFLGLQNRCAILHVANPPSMACYFSARNNYVP
ncbi:MAG: hypothetical protein II413_09085, partial [Treponema sp.]|nr:hypothetical protein [Treponema sp.]